MTKKLADTKKSWLIKREKTWSSREEVRVGGWESSFSPGDENILLELNTLYKEILCDHMSDCQFGRFCVCLHRAVYMSFPKCSVGWVPLCPWLFVCLLLTLFNPGFLVLNLLGGGADLPPPTNNGGNGREVPKLSWNLISYRDWCRTKGFTTFRHLEPPQIMVWKVTFSGGLWGS